MMDDLGQPYDFRQAIVMLFLAGGLWFVLGSCEQNEEATAEAEPPPPPNPMAVTEIAVIDRGEWSPATRIYRVVDTEAGMVLYVTGHGRRSIAMSAVKIADTALGPKWVKPAGSGNWERVP